MAAWGSAPDKDLMDITLREILIDSTSIVS